NITYTNIQLDSVTNYGLSIQQDYGGPSGKAVSNSKISNIKGTTPTEVSRAGPRMFIRPVFLPELWSMTTPHYFSYSLV
ncbi:hypothetical protein BC830DRAFT_1157644, partial [Chytriomyces sp. MP71]